MARLACANEVNGRIFNIIGETTTQDHLVSLVGDVFGIDVRYVPVSDEDNVARLMKDERIAARGEPIARMLTGCFQAMRKGVFDVASDYQSDMDRRRNQ